MIAALLWGCVFAAAGLNGWLLLIACSIVFVLVMCVMSLCNVAR
jgi:hypothetical protein